MWGCTEIIFHFYNGALSLSHITDSVWCSGSRERSLHVTSLSKERFVPSCTHSSGSTRRPVICYMRVDLSSATPSPHRDPPPMLRWRSIVFVLYVNVYQRVPTVNTSTYKVMYWHGRFHRDCAELSVYRGCAAEGRVGRRGNTAVV